MTHAPSADSPLPHTAAPTTAAPSPQYILHRRFDRLARLLGEPAVDRLMKSHVMIIGLGGVGSWAAESLARSGVGRLSLVDFDAVCITNTNRQLHAMHGAIGRKKADLMAERMSRINPASKIEGIPAFYSAETSDELLARDPDLILDCSDNITAKCHLLARCRQEGRAVITAGGAGSRLDLTRIHVDDLSRSHNDPFLQQVRYTLRRDYGFPSRGRLGIACVYSSERPLPSQPLTYDCGKGFQCVCPMGQNDFHSCERRNIIHGTASFLTGAFGLHMAAHAVKLLTDDGGRAHLSS